MDIFSAFGLISGIIAVIAYSIYFKQILKSQSTPNPSSWAIWLLTGIINAFTYFSVTHGNIWQSLIVIVVLISTFTIFIYSLLKGKFTKVSEVEILIFILAFVLGIFWQTTLNARISNLLLQGIYLLSYIPTILGIIRGSGKEEHLSWSVVLLAYVFSALSIITGPHSDWIIFLNPLINGLLGTGLTVFFIIYKNRQNNATV